MKMALLPGDSASTHSEADWEKFKPELPSTSQESNKQLTIFRVTVSEKQIQESRQ